MTTPKNIFISHATKDDAQVDSIAQKLQLATHTTWVDHHGKIPAGTPDWDKAIRKAIVACDVGVLVMTENSLASEICKAECLLILELKKPLYIIRAEAFKPENIWLFIKLRQYANIVAQFDLGMNHLIRAINGETDPSLPTPIYFVTGKNSMNSSVSQLDTPLRGRDTEVNLVRDWLKTGGLVQIIAVGGLGKSRLCAEIALSHPHGAVWHKCSSSTNANDVLIALRDHLNLSVDAKEELVADKMAERHSILVIDNAEDVTHDNRVAYIELFSQLAYRGVPMLLTSREKWHSDKFASRAYTLPDFTDAHLADVMQMTHDFIRKFGKHFTDDEAKQLAQAGRLHPELIEIAVGLIGGGEYDLPTTLKRLNELHPKDIQKALDEMITKTLAQMKERTTDGANAYDLIHRLTWVQASFTSDVIAVFKPDSITEDNLPDALATLRRYQFLRYDDSTKRYRIPDLVRDTIGTPKDPALFDMYAKFYIFRAIEIFENTSIENWSDKEGGANFDDVVNIKALGGELMRQQPKDVSDLERVMQFSTVTKKYIDSRIEAKVWDWLEIGINATRILQKKFPDELRLLTVESLLLNSIGVIYQKLARFDEALKSHLEYLSLVDKIGDESGKAGALNNIGYIYQLLGQPKEALSYYSLAMPIFSRLGNINGQASVINNIGLVYQTLGQVQDALESYEQVLIMRRKIGDKVGEATTLNNIGAVYNESKKLDKALEYFNQSLSLHREVGNKIGEANTLNSIGGIHLSQDNMDYALEYFTQSYVINDEIGDKAGKSASLNNIGMVYVEVDAKKSLNYFYQALEISRSISDKFGEAVTLSNIGGCFNKLNDKQSALNNYEQSLAIFKSIRAYPYVVSQQVLIAILFAEWKLLDKAIEQIELSLELMYSLKLTHAGSGETPEQIRLILFEFKRQRGDTDIPPEEPQESEFDALIARLADIYKQAGEAGLRQMLTENNLPEAQIDEIVTVVVAHIAGAGGDDADESAELLPFETVREWVSNTYTVMKRDTHELENWRGQLEGAKMRMVGMGDDWANEVAFVEALLAVLRGEFPVLPNDHPYHEPVRQLVEALK